MSYTIELDDDNILHLTIIGKFTPEDTKAYVAEADRLVSTSLSGQAVFILVDTTQTGGKIDRVPRQAIMEMTRRNKAGKVALVGVSPHIRVMAGLINKIIGQGRVQFFATKEEALAWLRNREVK
jgi:hypothetical protein